MSQILVEGRRAVGVQLRDGTRLHSRQAVASAASVWDTLALLPPDLVPARYRQQRQQTPACDSFMHLHLGLDETGAIARDVASVRTGDSRCAIAL